MKSLINIQIVRIFAPKYISMRDLVLAVFLIGAFVSCKNDQSKSGSDGSISAIVNIPVGPDEIIDTSVAAHLSFETTLVDWDTLRTGQSFTYAFEYTNTGQRPAIISDVKTSCGCTATTFTKDPIQPGGKGQVEVTFNSTGRLGYQKKSINVIGNTYPTRTLLYLQGFVSK